MAEDNINPMKGVLDVIEDVPGYKAFFTVDELKTSSKKLARKYPDRVEVLNIGHSRRGDPIEALKIGSGPKQAVLFAMPHPNEPIGSMTLEYLSSRLVEDDSLLQSLNHTWYLIKCIDPDGARLNEGWFKGPFTVENYTRHYYRPASFQQIEWTFPIDYKTLHFNSPLPETQTLMSLIRKVRPDFLYSIHNAGFGGAYFYISEATPSLYNSFHQLVDSQGLPLHLGEPEEPHIPKYAEAIFKITGAQEQYDYLEKHTSEDPANIFKAGTDSFAYTSRFCHPFGLVCEVPYFYHPAIEDNSVSDIPHREAILSSIESEREELNFLKEQYNNVKEVLTVISPFREAIEEYVRFFEYHLSAEENWACTELRVAEKATVAEEFDNLRIRRFYQLFPLCLFIRLLESEMEAGGKSSILSSTYDTISDAFTRQVQEFENEVDYQVIPIQKLVRIQLGSALIAAKHVSH
ncbi:MAG: hypothetical protein JSV77_08230 [Dehalococcoidales bacterium]|nr:MAG: hypothetical protein JSV77_08230 [Dehalococcoidales bacterium]